MSTHKSVVMNASTDLMFCSELDAQLQVVTVTDGDVFVNVYGPESCLLIRVPAVEWQRLTTFGIFSGKEQHTA